MIGAGINRIDGPLKVSGRAIYSYERQEAGQPLYGFIRGAAIGKGRITHIDVSVAAAAPGVHLVWTHLNAPAQGIYVAKPTMFDRPRPQLTSDRITYYGEPVAFVVAETFEAARHAAGLVRIDYEAELGVFDLRRYAENAEKPETLSIGMPAEVRMGDIDAAMAQGPVTVDESYDTPYHFSQAMEPPAALADWRDRHLTVYVATQMVAQTRTAIADTLSP